MNPKIYPFEVGAFKCVSISDGIQPIDCGCVSGIGIVLNGGYSAR